MYRIYCIYCAKSLLSTVKMFACLIFELLKLVTKPYLHANS